MNCLCIFFVLVGYLTLIALCLFDIESSSNRNHQMSRELSRDLVVTRIMTVGRAAVASVRVKGELVFVAFKETS